LYASLEWGRWWQRFDVASHVVDGVVQGFVLTWPIKAAFLAAAGAVLVRTRVLPSLLGWSALAAAAMLVVGAPLSGRAGGPLFLVFVLWVLAASVVLLRVRSRPAHDRWSRRRDAPPPNRACQDGDGGVPGRWQELSSALLGRPI
jgi:hypothetical protein